MAIIDPDGLFGGDRLRGCSDLARLLWPYLYLASNGYGRLELNRHRIVARCFSDFGQPPSEPQLIDVLEEYQRNRLLFVYEVGGQLWGAWDTPSKSLPDYKTARDRKSPAPPEPEFSQWRKAYRDQKTPLAKLCPNISQKFSENFPLGVGIGIGKGLNTCASQEPDARVCAAQISTDDPPFVTTEPDALFPVAPQGRAARSKSLESQQVEWLEEFMAIFWRKKDRKRAWTAFKRHVKTLARFEQVMAAVRAQTPEMLSREERHRPYAATWLNGERWEDQTEAQSTAAQNDDYPELTA